MSRPRRRDVRPVLSRLPAQPRELAEAGLCARHPHPEWWTSDRADEREAAATVCGWCPVLARCRSWALGLPSADNAVYGATDSRARREMRQALQQTPCRVPSAA